MTSNGPYYQSVQSEQGASDDIRIPQSLLEYGPLAPQASMYPDPNQPQINSEYHAQQLAENDAEDHAQLQGLVEAATSAAAQEQIRQRSQLPVFAPNQDNQDDTSEQELVTLLRENDRATLVKRKRSASQDSVTDLTEHAATAASDRPKRQKRATIASPTQLGQEGELTHRQLHNPIESPHNLDARAAGVHSAAALFRPPSDSSKKYTRPPMSKLFTSLELSPENFLYLQAAAKQFMLDPEHPERQACVGNRGKGDSDLVKLRLHHCVREFLETGGWGEKYFGENAPPPGDLDTPAEDHQRKFLWPKDKDRIIALCTPLLRRMVTNERQRQYAVESRKGVKPDKSNGVENEHDPDHNQETQSAEPSLPHNPYDPSLPQGPAYQVYILNRETKQLIRDRLDYPPHQDFSWDIMTQEVQRCWSDVMQIEPQSPDAAATDFLATYSVKLLTSGGLATVSNEGEWQLACQDARQAVWLENVIKVIVERSV